MQNTQLTVSYNAKLEPGAGGFSYLAVARQGAFTSQTMDLINMPSNAKSVGGVYSGSVDYRIRHQLAGLKTEMSTQTQNNNGKTVSKTYTFSSFDTTIFHVRYNLKCSCGVSAV